jgi:Xaa-Pro aminopeptidase
MESDAILITDGRYTVQVKAQCPDYSIEIAPGSGGYSEALKKVLANLQTVSTLGYDDSDLTVSRLKALRSVSPKQIRWMSASGVVEKLRFVKDAGEIALMGDAIRVAERAFDTVRGMFKEGVRERDFAIELEFTMRKLGADSPSFDTIVASGPNGALPHYHAGERAFEAGDLVTIDWGAQVNGYCSDITRTVAIPGKSIDPKLREIYNIVQRAKIASVAACKSGASGKSIDTVARDIISEAGFGDAFSHSLGHSLGIITHDGVTLSQRAAKVKLTPGVVTTVEPGIYMDGLGGVRIEEDVLVTEGGSVVLTTADDEMM